MRQTSLSAYHTIKLSGVLGERTWQTYDALFQHGPLTQAECWQAIGAAVPQRSVTPRFAELLRKGFIRYLDGDNGRPAKRKCRVSGKLCMVWDVTDAMSAAKVARQPSTPLARANERIRQLERRNTQLMDELTEANERLKRWGRPTDAERQARALASTNAPCLL